MKKLLNIIAVVLLAVSISTIAVAEPKSRLPHSKAIPDRLHGFLERANPKAIEKAVKAQQRHNKSLFDVDEVVGTAVSWDEDGESVVHVYVKHPGKGGTYGKNKKIPDSIDGVPVVVIASGPVYPMSIPCEERQGSTCGDTVEEITPSADPTNRTGRLDRPVPIGVSGGHVDVTAGTIGCRVTAGCHTYALSNAHVFADENNGVEGDHILQPGPADGGSSPDDLIGTLAASVPITISLFASNKVDAAIAIVTEDTVGHSTPEAGYGRPRQEIVAAEVNMDVMKYGRTTGMRYGYIGAINGTFNVAYEAGTARFVSQMVIYPSTAAKFSKPGDSGSLIVATGGIDDRKPVGLLFAAADGFTVANPIDEVLSLLGVEIDGD